MNLYEDMLRANTRRHFFQQGSHALGWAALASLVGDKNTAGAAESAQQPRKSSREVDMSWLVG